MHFSIVVVIAFVIPQVTAFELPKKCSRFPDFPKAIVHGGRSEIGSIRTFECVGGYFVDVRQAALPEWLQFRCLSNGTWQKPKMSCLKVTHSAIYDAISSPDDSEHWEYLISQVPPELDGFTATFGLLYASEVGNVDFVKLLFGKYGHVTPLLNVNTRSESKGYTPLLNAIKGNHNKLVLFLLEKNADIHVTTYEHHVGPMNLAATQCNYEVMQRLMQFGAAVDLADDEGYTALHIAASNECQPEIVRFLIDYGANVDATTLDGVTPILLAARFSSVAKVRNLLNGGCNVNATDLAASSALHLASLKCNDELIKLLMLHNADINAKNSKGHSPLMMAVLGNCPITTYELLVSNGAKVDEKDNKGFSLLMLAASNSDNAESIRYLLNFNPDVKQRSKTNVDAFLTAANYGRFEACQLLADAGANLESRDTEGNTALILAARRNHTAAVDVLLRLGCNVNAVNKRNWTALMFAASGGFLKIAEQLVYIRNIDVNTIDYSGPSTAVTIAARNGNYRVVTLLLEQGFTKLQSVTRFNDTVLTMLASYGDVELDARMFDYLMERGHVNVTQRDIYGANALLFAVKRNHSNAVVSTLLKHGADANAKSIFGETPLSLAIEADRLDLVETLLEYCDVEAPILDDTTALILATRLRRYSIARLLIESGNADITQRDASGQTAMEIAAHMVRKSNREILMNTLTRKKPIKY